ncbi:MAG: BamA/TamA family outer membrane protein [Pseudodesulfovibrio sp.]
MNKLIIILIFLITAAGFAPACFADGDVNWLDQMDSSSDVAEEQGSTFSDRIVVTPVPMVNPTLQAGIIGLGMYMHPEGDFGNDEGRTDNATRQSITGLAAMATTNKSWATGVFHKGFYDDDRYRGSVYLAYGDFNLKYYGVGDDSILRDRPLKYSAKVTAFQPKFYFRVADNWYVGPKYSVFKWDIGMNFSDLHSSLPDIKHTFTTAGLGLAGEWDTTDHSIYATDGGKFEFSVMDYDDRWGGDFEYGKLETNYNHYWTMTKRLVLAARYDLNLSTGSTPFFDMPSLHLRGFPYAQYIDKQSSSIQGEARYKLTKRWSTNVFAGVGWIGTTPDELYSRPIIPTGGVGLRYLIAEEEKMNLGMDIAFGPDSKAVYFSVGEWF